MLMAQYFYVFVYESKKEIMNEQEDSLIIFKSRDEKWLDKEIIGQEKNIR
jgi:CRISPR/Cas system-associated endoribonuclease Cas2